MSNKNSFVINYPDFRSVSLYTFFSFMWNRNINLVWTSITIFFFHKFYFMRINKHQTLLESICNSEKNVVCAIFPSWRSDGNFSGLSDRARKISGCFPSSAGKPREVAIGWGSLSQLFMTGELQMRFIVIGISPFTTLVCGKNRFLIKSYIVIILLWIWNLIKSLCFNIFLTTCLIKYTFDFLKQIDFLGETTCC